MASLFVVGRKADYFKNISRFQSKIYVTERLVTQLYSTLHATVTPTDLTDRS